MEYLGAKPANIIVPAALFALLTPGMILSVGGPSMAPNMTVVAIHAAVFAGSYALLRRYFPDVY